MGPCTGFTECLPCHSPKQDNPHPTDVVHSKAIFLSPVEPSLSDKGVESVGGLASDT